MHSIRMSSIGDSRQIQVSWNFREDQDRWIRFWEQTTDGSTDQIVMRSQYLQPIRVSFKVPEGLDEGMFFRISSTNVDLKFPAAFPNLASNDRVSFAGVKFQKNVQTGQYDLYLGFNIVIPTDQMGTRYSPDDWKNIMDEIKKGTAHYLSLFFQTYFQGLTDRHEWYLANQDILNRQWWLVRLMTQYTANFNVRLGSGEIRSRLPSDDESKEDDEKFKVGDKVLLRESIEMAFDLDGPRYEIIEILGRDKWKYRLDWEGGGYTTEDFIRIAPKFKVGDKVVYSQLGQESPLLKVTRVYWDTEDETYMYELKHEDESFAPLSTEDELLPAPKFDVGDKVKMDVGFGTFEIRGYRWNSQLNQWEYNFRIEDGEDVSGFQTEDNLRPASNERKLNSEDSTPAKKKYLEEPLKKGDRCSICLDPLLGPYNKWDDGKVINLGLDRDVQDDKGNVIGKENSDEVVIMYCCGNGFHKRCIDTWFSEGRSLRKCPGCNRDLNKEINEGKAVYRNAEVVKKGKETVEVETVTEIKLCAFKRLKF